MTRVSKRKIKDEDFKKIFDKFIEIIDLSRSRKNIGLFTKEFFSPAERIMLAKRIEIIYMVIEKIPDRVIADTLSVSTSTIGRIIEKYDRGEYRYLDSIMKRNKESLMDIIEKIYFIIPPRVGRKRYRFVKQNNLF